MKQFAVLLISTVALSSAWAGAASAEPHYRAHYYYPPPVDYYDAPAPVGFVFMRHSSRCEYPRGWSVGDFSRSVNGIPRGGDELLATGCGRYDPLID
jgi:hypothetical protein